MAEAAPRVGKSVAPIEALHEFASDFLDDADAIDAEVEALRAQGLLTPEAEAELKGAADDAKTAADYATAYETLATCVVRFGA